MWALWSDLTCGSSGPCCSGCLPVGLGERHRALCLHCCTCPSFLGWSQHNSKIIQLSYSWVNKLTTNISLRGHLRLIKIKHVIYTHIASTVVSLKLCLHDRYATLVGMMQYTLWNDKYVWEVVRHMTARKDKAWWTIGQRFSCALLVLTGCRLILMV